jgi:hypothetical protein
MSLDRLCKELETDRKNLLKRQKKRNSFYIKTKINEINKKIDLIRKREKLEKKYESLKLKGLRTRAKELELKIIKEKLIEVENEENLIKQKEEKELNDPYYSICNYVETFFEVDLTKLKKIPKTKVLQQTPLRMRRDSVLIWSFIHSKIKSNSSLKNLYSILSCSPEFDKILEEKLRERGIFTISKQEGVKKYGFRGKLIQIR